VSYESRRFFRPQIPPSHPHQIPYAQTPPRSTDTRRFSPTEPPSTGGRTPCNRRLAARATRRRGPRGCHAGTGDRHPTPSHLGGRAPWGGREKTHTWGWGQQVVARHLFVRSHPKLRYGEAPSRLWGPTRGQWTTADSDSGGQTVAAVVSGNGSGSGQ
jgi:hypothetical protein